MRLAALLALFVLRVQFWVRVLLEKRADQSVSISRVAISGPILRARRQHCTEQQAALLNSKAPEHAAGRTITLTRQQREPEWIGNSQGCCAEPHGAGLCHRVSVSLGIQQQRLRRSPALAAFHLSSSSYSQSACVQLIDLESSRQEALSYPSYNLGSELHGAGFSELFCY